MAPCEVPASVSQRLLWMIQHYRPEFGALNCPVLCRVDGPLDVDALQHACDGLVARHESLRTTFAGRGSRLTQRVHDPRPLPIRMVDLTGATDPVAALRAAIATELNTPVDPTEWPARAVLWRLGATAHTLCLTVHHLVTDAWSTGILLRDLCALYGGTQPAAPGWQYRRFVDWQREMLADARLDRHRQYWRRQLTGAQLPTLWPAERATPGPPTASLAVALDVDPTVVTRLRGIARERRTTLFSVLLAIFYAHLHRTTGQRELAVGSMFANRSRPELRGTVGLMANMVLLRVSVSRSATFDELVGQTHAAVIGAFTYQDLPFQMLPSTILDSNGGQADDVVFNVMADLEHVTTVGGVRFELLVPDDIASRFRFELALAPVGGHDLRAVLFHAGGSLDATECDTFLAGYADLAAAVAATPERRLSHVIQHSQKQHQH